jgi:hypothetical protein
MHRSPWIRRAHRRLSIVSMLAVVANILVRGDETLALWVGLSSLLPFALLLLSGLCLLVSPHAARWRDMRR